MQSDTKMDGSSPLDRTALKKMNQRQATQMMVAAVPAEAAKDLSRLLSKDVVSSGQVTQL